MSASFGVESRLDKILNMDFFLIIARGANGRPSVRVTAGYPSLSRAEPAFASITPTPEQRQTRADWFAFRATLETAHHQGDLRL